MKKPIALLISITVFSIFDSCIGNKGNDQNIDNNTTNAKVKNGSEKNINSESNFSPVKIGEQVWMSKNLNVNTFSNGDVIPKANTETDWIKAAQEGSPAWCYYGNNDSNGEGEDYGKLYNWFAVNDKRGLAPKGWHIPSEKEWHILIKCLGNFEGMKMKSTTNWDSDDIHGVDGNGTNTSGFSAFPSGYRYEDSASSYRGFNGDSEECDFWSSTSVNTAYSIAFAIYANYRTIYSKAIHKGAGFSVRCIRDK